MNDTRVIRTSLLNFLADQWIIIPILQRDYAQGREGKEDMRKSFLLSFYDALCGSCNVDLDFVYGVVSTSGDGERWVAPLDGQQRLTTAWLIHCYIAYRSGILNNNETLLNTLKRFTYRTRTSSHLFLHQLVDFLSQRNYVEKERLVDVMENQTWFAAEWKCDPTIESSLRMLSGTFTPVIRNGVLVEEIPNGDGIEQVFTGNINFRHAWERLSGNGGGCPVTFYFYPLDEFRHPDDLYVKMNARGKPLTSFENLKADLGAYVFSFERSLEADEKYDNRFSHKLDGSWTDLFWKNKSDKPRVSIDEIYIAFINRFCLGRYIANYSGPLKRIEKDKTFLSLYGSEGNDTKYVYKSFDSYRESLAGGGASALSKVLDGYKSLLADDTPEKDDVRLFGMNFIPPYSYLNKDGQREATPIVNRLPELVAIDSVQQIHLCCRITQPERVKFHAIARFFECFGKREEAKQRLFEWMRFVNNIVNNTEIKTIDQMVRGIRMFDKIGPHSYNILSYLAAPTTSLDSIKLECGTILNPEQVKEEIDKARKMSDPIWSQKILSAETRAFLNGAIRCLIYNASGDVDWSNFDLRVQTFDKYFTAQGLAPGEIRPIIEIIQRSSVSQLKSYSFDTSAVTWKRILSYSQYRDVVDNFLRECPVPDVTCDQGLVNELCSKVFLSARIKQGGSWHLLWDWQGAHWILTQYARREKNPNRDFANQIWVLGRGRNNLIRKFCNVNGLSPASSNVYESDSGCFGGLYWDFTYDNQEFRLSGDELVTLMKSRWKDVCSDGQNAISWKCDIAIEDIGFFKAFEDALKSLIERGKLSGTIQ